MERVLSAVFNRPYVGGWDHSDVRDDDDNDDSDGDVDGFRGAAPGDRALDAEALRLRRTADSADGMGALAREFGGGVHQHHHGHGAGHRKLHVPTLSPIGDHDRERGHSGSTSDLSDAPSGGGGSDSDIGTGARSAGIAAATSSAAAGKKGYLYPFRSVDDALRWLQSKRWPTPRDVRAAEAAAQAQHEALVAKKPGSGASGGATSLPRRLPASSSASAAAPRSPSRSPQLSPALSGGRVSPREGTSGADLPVESDAFHTVHGSTRRPAPATLMATGDLEDVVLRGRYRRPRLTSVDSADGADADAVGAAAEAPVIAPDAQSDALDELAMSLRPFESARQARVWLRMHRDSMVAAHAGRLSESTHSRGRPSARSRGTGAGNASNAGRGRAGSSSISPSPSPTSPRGHGAGVSSTPESSPDYEPGGGRHGGSSRHGHPGHSVGQSGSYAALAASPLDQRASPASRRDLPVSPSLNPVPVAHGGRGGRGPAATVPKLRFPQAIVATSGGGGAVAGAKPPLRAHHGGHIAGLRSTAVAGAAGRDTEDLDSDANLPGGLLRSLKVAPEFGPWHALDKGARGFMYAYGLKAGLGAVMALFRANRLRGLAKAAASVKAIRFGLFFGALIGSHSLLRYFFFHLRGRDGRINGALAGALSGLSILLDHPAERGGMALYSLVRACYVVVHTWMRYGYVQRVPKASYALFALANVPIMYAAMLQPDLLNRGYYKWILNIGAMQHESLGVMREPYLDPTLQWRPCGPPWHEGRCLTAHTLEVPSRMVACGKMYLPVHALPLLLFRWRTLTKEPLSFATSVGTGTLKSAAFLSGYIWCLKTAVCLFRNVRGVDSWWHPAAGALATFAPLHFEKESRVSELMLYCIPHSLRVVWGALEQRGLVRNWGALGPVVIFCMASALVMSTERRDWKPTYARMLSFMFGREEDGVMDRW